MSTLFACALITASLVNGFADAMLAPWRGTSTGAEPHMTNELIIPNWHVILIHYPLGVFMLGMLLELLLLVFRHHGPVRSAARWMIVLGALAGLPAAYSGMYAL